MCNHNHGIHVPWYADPSHICWECFQCFSHPAMVEIHLRDTACTYGRGHFSNAVAIWAPLVLTMFQSIAQTLSLLNIEALASFVTSTHSEFLPGIDTPDTKDIEVFQCLQEYQQCSRAAQYRYQPPTCVEVLLQWRMLSGLLSLVPLPQRTSIMKVPSPGSATTTPAGLGSKPKSMAKAVSKVGPKQKQGPTARSTKAMPKADPKQRQGSATGKPKVVATSSIPSLLSIPTRAPGTLARTTAKSSAASVKAQPTVSPPPAASSIQSESATSDLASTIPLLGAGAHLHVPELITRSKLATLEAAILHIPAPRQLRVDHLFPSYCWPNQWPQSTTTLPAVARHISIGWHPTCATEVLMLMIQKFETVLHIPGVMALEEVGLDYEQDRTSEGRSHQRALLIEMCRLANLYHLPMVVHCRDVESHAGPPNRDASDACMVIMRKELPCRDHEVYLHCYNHGLPIFTSWLQCFPNVQVGISPLAITTRKHPGLIDVVQMLMPDRLLLETDAPYLPGPANLGYEGVGSPTLLYHIAAQVAEWSESTAEEVLLQARCATLQFYKL